MASGTDLVRAFIAALEAQQWDVAASYLSADFTFRGVGSPSHIAGKEAFLTEKTRRKPRGFNPKG